MDKQRINRRALVSRHNPTIRKIEPLSPLSIGNGEFAFTVDFSGLQSFPQLYEVPLGTQSQWGWHSSGGIDRYSMDDLRLQPYETHGRLVGYATNDQDQEEAFHWLRQNPHRVQLGQIGFRFITANGHIAGIEDIQEIEQTLDMWTGMLTSRFQVDGIPVEVMTCCRPEADQIGVRVESPLLKEERLQVAIAFPSPLPMSRDWSRSTHLNWGEDESHQTKFQRSSSVEGVFIRSMDLDEYRMHIAWNSGEILKDEEHLYRLVPHCEIEGLQFTFSFSPEEISESLPAFEQIAQESAAYWERFWSEGAAVELKESRDPRAFELERRIVLSQFLTAIHCAGSLPPQETGLLYNTWFGKFHLEMHWWHGVHFALWGRIGLFRKSLDWYNRILPSAKALAQSQGYKGARWPKMVGPQGQDSPSSVGTLLIWQQPHPIVYAELCYLAQPTRETLDTFSDIVMETAAFMASFAVWDAENNRYVLGPPMIPAQEDHKAETTWNPTFELEYWRRGLELAQTWRTRLGLEPTSEWEHVCLNLSALPRADGVYLAHENCTDTFTRVNTDHPSMLGALGILPGIMVDRETMGRTLSKVMKEWQWDTAWGWDFPMTAMTAARLGDGDTAVNALLMDAAKNTYLPNGHNYQREGLSAYLPGNGGLLTAVALMACGWQGGTDHEAPGFPSDGSWSVRWEGLNPWL